MAKAPRSKRPAPKKGGKGGSKSAARTPKSRTPKRTKSPSTPKVAGAYEVICSECYSDFDYNPQTSASQITCPVCMHVGQVAERDSQTRMQIAKGREKSKFLFGLIPGILMVIVGLIWISMISGNSNGEELSAGMNYGLLGTTLLLFIVTIFGVAKYESARHEVYF